LSSLQEDRKKPVEYEKPKPEKPQETEGKKQKLKNLKAAPASWAGPSLPPL
jgi:hypothetical protein